MAWHHRGLKRGGRTREKGLPGGGPNRLEEKEGEEEEDKEEEDEAGAQVP